ncbi:ricin-type beta-trefoil lectin domain protein [Paractinoplanes toevensis]|uniref:Ricin B lectin domain-containing protein n=1 Tax=Paractinoplanes toevensis TaxID=571911 RepID=A0A919T4B1_9ACTN|nr:ricin-type beta-trefoil lectin domain protein [Actinoplanes toevensis]GIM88432.1 hypothetical protein Ato02nite_002250 [Actinoplanes toevensis]
MTDDDYDEERDPLLVRPYLHGDAGADSGDPSTQTWPSATTREVRSQIALEGADDPTAILYLPEPPRRQHHRLLIVAAALALIVLGAGAAAVAALRTDGRPTASATLAEPPVPALTGLVPTARPETSAVTSSPVPSRSSHRSATAAATATSGKAASGKPSVTGTAAEDGKTVIAPGDAVAPEPQVTERTGTIRGQNGLCLDLNGGVAIAFNHIQVTDCNGTAAQRWTLATDGTLRVQGMCALILGDDTVHIVGCDGRTTARWRTSGQLIINAANDKCLTDPASGATAGTAVTVTTCNGRANERWSLP